MLIYTIRTVDNQSITISSFICLTLPLSRISLNTLTLNVKSDKVYTRHGVPISVTGIAQVSDQHCSLAQGARCRLMDKLLAHHGSSTSLIMQDHVYQAKLSFNHIWQQISHLIFFRYQSTIYWFAYKTSCCSALIHCGRGEPFLCSLNNKRVAVSPRWRSRVRINRCWLQPAKCSWASRSLRSLRSPWRRWRDTSGPSSLTSLLR